MNSCYMIPPLTVEVGLDSGDVAGGSIALRGSEPGEGEESGGDEKHLFRYDA